MLSPRNPSSAVAPLPCLAGRPCICSPRFDEIVGLGYTGSHTQFQCALFYLVVIYFVLSFMRSYFLYFCLCSLSLTLCYFPGPRVLPYRPRRDSAGVRHPCAARARQKRRQKHKQKRLTSQAGLLRLGHEQHTARPIFKRRSCQIQARVEEDLKRRGLFLLVRRIIS